MSELQQAINEMRTMRESYDQLVSQNAQLASDVQAIKDAHILSFNYDGIVFAQGYEPLSAFGVIANRANILEMHDNKDTVLPKMAAADYPILEVFEMTKATSGNADAFLYSSASIKKIIIPSYVGSANNGINRCAKLSYLDVTFAALSPGGNGCISECPVLIDVHAGGIAHTNFVARAQMLLKWSPDEALLDNSTTLLTDEDIAAGFTSNLQKLLWNIRNHIAANLQDRTGLSSLTITFSAAVKAAILADQETADAFTNKNWTIA